jgi:hypothetical protein
MEEAAKEAARESIVQSAQLPSNFIGEGQQTAGIGDDFFGYLERNNMGIKGVKLNPAGAEYPGAPYGYEPGNAFFERGGVRLNPVDLPQSIEPFDIGPGNLSDDLKNYINSGNVEGGDYFPDYESFLSNQAERAAQSGIPSQTTASIGSQDIGINQGGQGIRDLRTLGDYQLNYTKPPVSEIGMESNFSLNPDRTSFRSLGDTDLSASLPKSQAGLSDPTANIGNRIPTIQGDYTQTESALDKGMRLAEKYFDKASKYVETDPYKSAALAYYGAYKTGMLDQPKQEPIADNYKNPYSMAGFRRSSPSPSAYRYTPRYAEGGIAGYAKGGRSKTEAAMDFYDAMNPRRESAPLSHGSPGIYYDADPDTRYLDPMEAAMVRMSKLNSRANVQAPTMTPSRRMGELDFKPVAAAQGGIMGYASGGDVPIEEDQFNMLTGRGGLPEKDTDPKSWANLSDADKAAHYKERPNQGAFNRVLYQGLKFAPVVGPLLRLQEMTNPEFVANQQAIWNGYDPAAFAEGPPDPNFSGQAAAAARQEGQIAAVNAANAAGAGLAANPMSTDPSQRGGYSGAPSVGSDVGRSAPGSAHLAQGGGIMGYNLGGYAAGGNPRLLRGPGDGMSDHIPATINNRQPARLADGEYVITADVVSHLGNGSTEAGARQLDAMMKRIRKGRTGTPKQGKQINPRKYLPA